MYLPPLFVSPESAAARFVRPAEKEGGQKPSPSMCSQLSGSSGKTGRRMGAAPLPRPLNEFREALRL